MNLENEETVSLPESGKVTGKITIVWLAGGKARVRSEGYVSFRDREWKVSATLQQETGSGTWERVADGCIPVAERTSTSVWDTTPKTFRRAILTAVTDAVAGAWSVDKARTAGRVAAQRDLDAAVGVRDRLMRELVVAREAVTAAERKLALYTD